MFNSLTQKVSKGNLKDTKIIFIFYLFKLIMYIHFIMLVGSFTLSNCFNVRFFEQGVKNRAANSMHYADVTKHSFRLYNFFSSLNLDKFFPEKFTPDNLDGQNPPLGVGNVTGVGISGANNSTSATDALKGKGVHYDDEKEDPAAAKRILRMILLQDVYKKLKPLHSRTRLESDVEGSSRDKLKLVQSLSALDIDISAFSDAGDDECVHSIDIHEALFPAFDLGEHEELTT